MVSNTPFPISTLPAPNEIVWCKFPYHDSLGKPGPKPRPALVKNVARLPNNAGEVQLIYGTTNVKSHQRPHDFTITNMSEMNACGLYKATRFDLDTISWIPWSAEWFEILPGYSSPVIGRLTEHGIKMLEICISFKQASR